MIVINYCFSSKKIMFPSTYRQSQIIQGYVLLLLTAFLWGTAFIFQKNATDYVDAFTFNFLRFSVAIPALLLLRLLPKKLFLPDSKDIPAQKRFRHSAWFIGLGGAFFMFVGISLQQWGLAHTTTGKSGFLTSLYIIVVPVMALFIGQRCRLEVWVGAILTIVGVYLLGNGAGDAESQFNIGDVVTLLCTLGWAAQVLWLGVFARYANVLNVATIQMLGVAILSGLVSLFFGLIAKEGTYHFPTWSVIWNIKNDILYTGVISAAVAFTLQIFGQRYVSATNAALVMSTEAIFALLAGVIFLDEQVTLLALFGACLIMLGIVLAQLQGRIFLRSN
ncbi:MAG: DMT family transporter [Ostreibacterium sp.]